VLVKIGDIWVWGDLIIADMIETDDAQIILGRPFLDTLGCNIDVKRGWITFEAEGCYAMFCFVDERVVSRNSSQFDAFSLSPEIDMEDDFDCQDPPAFDWISTEDPDEGCVKLESTTPMPPGIPKVEAYASNEYPISDYCRFTQAVLSLRPTEGVDLDFGIGIEHDDSAQSDGPCNWLVLYTDNMLWCHLMMTKDLF